MDARLRDGVRLFNSRRFFESHECLEDFYLRTEEEHKPFIEGLVQLAIACRLFCDLGEIQGPLRMIRQALIRLENYQPACFGIRVKALIEAMENWIELVEAGAGASVDLQERIPKIRRHWFLIP